MDKTTFEIIMKQANGDFMTALTSQLQKDISCTREEALQAIYHILDIVNFHDNVKIMNTLKTNDYKIQHRWFCPENYNLITNFDKEKEFIYEKAISEYGWDGLYITSDAYDRYGKKLRNTSALRCTEQRDLSEFWKIYHRIALLSPAK